MSHHEIVRDRVARILYERFSIEQRSGQPWRKGQWLEHADRVIKEVLAGMTPEPAAPLPSASC